MRPGKPSNVGQKSQDVSTAHKGKGEEVKKGRSKTTHSQVLFKYVFWGQRK